MKSLQLVGPKEMRCIDVPDPENIGANDILVRVKATSICGTDIHYYQGHSIRGPQLRFPVIMGHECSGLVEAVGNGVSNLRPGDRVAIEPAVNCGACEDCLGGYPNVCKFGYFIGTPDCPGSLQDLLVHPAHLAFKLPEKLDYVEGALLEHLGVALNAVNLGNIHVSDTVAVLGCGPIGLLIIQLAHLSGAKKIYASEVVEARRNLASICGADVIYDPRTEDVIASITKATCGRGVDIAFEVAGAYETPGQTVSICRGGGTAVIVGIPRDDRIVFPAGVSRQVELTIKMARRMRHTFERSIALAESGMIDLKKTVTHFIQFEEGWKGFDLLTGYKDDVGKVVIVQE